MNTDNQWKIGLVLSLITAGMWGMLPFVIRPLLDVMDPFTITFYRLAGGGVIILGWLVFNKQKLPKIVTSIKTISLLVIAIISIAANYVLWLYGLELTSPATAQVVIQLAPMLLLLGSVVIFGEAFSLKQFVGVIIFIFGFGLFFNQKLMTMLSDFSGYNLGVYYIVLASIVWAIYALSQKKLLNTFQPLHLITIINIVAAILYLPFSHPEVILSLSRLHFWLLIAGMVNTAVAYGCFIEAMRHWETPRVSAVVTIVPVLSLIIGSALFYFAPNFLPAENLNNMSIIGAIVVVAGSAITALSKSSRKNH